jgi:hypothetical protein
LISSKVQSRTRGENTTHYENSISSKVQSRTRGENTTHYENSIYCLPSNEDTKSI